MHLIKLSTTFSDVLAYKGYFIQSFLLHSSLLEQFFLYPENSTAVVNLSLSFSVSVGVFVSAPSIRHLQYPCLS